MVFYYRHLDTQCHSPPHQGWSRWDSPGGSPSRCVSCWCFSWHGMMMMVTVDIRWCSPGIGDQGGTAEAGHRHTKAGGEAVLGHAGEGVRVLQLGIDDAQSVVGVALAWVDNPTCRVVKGLFSKKNGIAHQNSHCKKFNLYNSLWWKQRALNTFHQYTFSQRHIFYTIAIALLLSLCFCNAIVLQ